jgi:hypothetical protein
VHQVRRALERQADARNRAALACPAGDVRQALQQGKAVDVEPERTLRAPGRYRDPELLDAALRSLHQVRGEDLFKRQLCLQGVAEIGHRGADTLAQGVRLVTHDVQELSLPGGLHFRMLEQCLRRGPNARERRAAAFGE